MKIQGEIDTTIQGIPCQILIGSYHKQKPLGTRADSDVDARGYVEAEYTILDRKGYQAKWLERKMTQDDHENVTIAIADYKDAEAENNRAEARAERREYDREDY